MTPPLTFDQCSALCTFLELGSDAQVLYTFAMMRTLHQAGMVTLVNYGLSVKKVVLTPMGHYWAVKARLAYDEEMAWASGGS